jgi:mannitol-1-/sugar-/sorbitol-6-/2-deoxyglucose-6-phosphatase
MKIQAAFLDMDGLLIDSEPLWNEAAKEVFAEHNIHLTNELYHTTTGLRTKEFVQYWLQYFKADEALQPMLEQKITDLVLQKIIQQPVPMPGVHYLISLLRQLQIPMAVVSSSPMQLINEVVQILGIQHHLQFCVSAEDLPYGKPHPAVYLQAAELMNVVPWHCLCFEDSFNGMLAAKAARMKCIVVPTPAEAKHKKWGAADAQLSSLQNCTQLLLQGL